MSRDLIYQVNVGEHTPGFYHFCNRSVASYAQQIGVHYELLTEPVLRIRPLKSARSKEAVEKNGYLPIYEKENVFGMLDEYDRILVIDSDVFIKPDSPNIFDELGDATFAASVERDMPITEKYRQKLVNYTRGQYGRLDDVDWKWDSRGAEFFNLGVMMFSTERIRPYLRGETPEEFVRRKEFEPLVNGEGAWRWSTEQTMLNWWVRREKMNLKYLSWRWNAMYGAIQDEALFDAHFIHFFLSVHLPESGAEIPQLARRYER